MCVCVSVRYVPDSYCFDHTHRPNALGYDVGSTFRESDSCVPDLQEVWDTFSDCEHAHPLYVEHLEGHGADECKDDYEC